MSGHSKWSKIKRGKEASDSKRGAMFTKLRKAISIAAKTGGDPEMNPALRTAIEKARASNMPKDNIEKAIQKGTGEIPGVVYEEVTYEGYGPGGTAVIMECVTDNTNRTVSSLRHILTKNGGSLGGANSVLYMFQQKGVARIATQDIPKNGDALEMALIDAGAEDIRTEDDGMTIYTDWKNFHLLMNILEEQGVAIADSGIEWITDNHMEPSEQDAAVLGKLVEELEEDDDVNAVYTNADQ